MKLLKQMREVGRDFKKMCRYSRGLTYASIILSFAVTVLGFAMRLFAAERMEMMITDAALTAPKILFFGLILAFFTDIVVKNNGGE